MQADPHQVSPFVLAGGRSTRMGSDKAFVMLEGRSLLARALDLARSVSENVRIVGDPAKFAKYAPTVEDIFPNCGPLGAIHAALRASQAELNLILAVDLPFVAPRFLEYLVTRSQSVPSALVTVAYAVGGWQPLCAVYRRPFADAAEQALHTGRYKIDALFGESRIQRITEEDLRTAGFSTMMFRNLNTPEDLANANRYESPA